MTSSGSFNRDGSDFAWLSGKQLGDGIQFSGSFTPGDERDFLKTEKRRIVKPRFLFRFTKIGEPSPPVNEG